MLDKAVTMPYTRVFQEARKKGLLTDDDVKACLYLLAALERPIVDVRKEMEEQPRLRAAVGYYFRHLESRSTSAQNDVEKRFLGVYNSIYSVKYSGKKTLGLSPDSIGRFSDKLVMAQAMQDPNFVIATEEAEDLKSLARHFGELRDSYNARSRYLEQIANHERFAGRDQPKEE